MWSGKHAKPDIAKYFSVAVCKIPSDVLRKNHSLILDSILVQKEVKLYFIFIYLEFLQRHSGITAGEFTHKI